MNYCARQDVYNIGLSPEMFRRPLREIEGVDPTSGTLTLRSHGLAAGAPLTFAVASSSTLGAPAAALPTGAPLTGYALPLNSDAFQIASTPSGAALTFTDSGAGIFGVIVDHGLYLDAAIAAASAVFDQYARAHEAPISSAIAPVLCAYLAARIYVAAHASGDPKFLAAVEPPSWLRSILDKLFSIYLKEAPILGAVDATPSTAEAGAVLVKTARLGDFDLPCRGEDGGLDVA